MGLKEMALQRRQVGQEGRGRNPQSTKPVLPDHTLDSGNHDICLPIEGKSEGLPSASSLGQALEDYARLKDQSLGTAVSCKLLETPPEAPGWDSPTSFPPLARAQTALRSSQSQDGRLCWEDSSGLSSSTGSCSHCLPLAAEHLPF